MPSATSLSTLLQSSFTLVFIAFLAGAFFFFLEKDRVPEDFKLPLRVSVVYLGIAAINYFYMQEFYAGAGGEDGFPTHFRYIDWILTTPLMLLKFPLLLGVGDKGKSFMVRLVALDLVMIITGYVGELHPGDPLLHYGLFLAGCAAWVAIVVMLFSALASLPDRLEDSLRKGVRTMGMFVVAGWAIYPLGYFAPLLQLPPEARELIYNVADLVNKIGLCLLVYVTAKRTGFERVDEELVADNLGPYVEDVPAPYGSAGHGHGYGYEPAE
jgi:bacteriorhodopsin